MEGLGGVQTEVHLGESCQKQASLCRVTIRKLRELLGLAPNYLFLKGEILTPNPHLLVPDGIPNLMSSWE